MDYNNIITVKFAQAERPKFEERRGKGYIEFGANNDYPNYLLDLYNESPKHGAIIKGKANYIYGKGFENIAVKANVKGESFNQVAKKCILDDEIFSGYYLQVIWNLLGKVKDVYHVGFQKVRSNKEATEFKIKENWADNKEEARCYPSFNADAEFVKVNPIQILSVKQYNPKGDIYPLPSYFQGLNYIESDVQVSRHILGNAKDGFVATTLINLNGGEPEEEAKAAVEKGIKKKFTGSEGDRVVIMFNKSKDNAAEIVPLSSTMLTKEDFTNINNLIQQEIFACHQITSPALFGIKTEGQLGGRGEMRDAYEIFNNTYVNSRQQAFEETFATLLKYAGAVGEFKIVPVEPIKFEFGEMIASQNLTKDEIRDIMGKEPLDPSIKTQAQIISDNINALSPLVANKVLESMTPDEIRSLAGLIPAVANGQQVVGDGSMPTPTPASPINSNLANMTGKQYQHLDRIKSKYKKGKSTRQEAAMILKNSFGLSDEDIAIMLDADSSEAQFASHEEMDFALIESFAQCGESIDNYEVLSSKHAFEKDYFADTKQLSELEANVLNLIKKDKRITADVIASTLKLSPSVIAKVMTGLETSGLIKSTSTQIGADTIIERTSTGVKVGGDAATTTDILLRYSYSWRQDISAQEKESGREGSRPFCQRMMDMGRLYSRAEIENISMKLGYSAWDRVGGWWTREDGTHSPQCRHTWNALTVIRKK